jgi:D-glycero-D-manno-heptose 1,7-bisphosphate phosphatase
MLVLLDRDGVLNENRADYVKSPAELRAIPGAAEAVARLNAAGHRVVVCTQQSAVGKGIIDRAMLERIHAALAELLRSGGARLDGILAATEPPGDPSPRLKPRPGMLLEAMTRYGATPAETVFIGDSLRDLQAAAAAGCRRILVRTGNGAKTQAAGLPADVLPVEVANDLAAAVDRLLAGEGRAR